MNQPQDRIEGAPLIKPSTTDHPLYEQVVEGRPAIAQQLVEEFIETPIEAVKSGQIAPVINYDKLLDSLSTIEALYRERQEMDDEEVFLLL